MVHVNNTILAETYDLNMRKSIFHLFYKKINNRKIQKKILFENMLCVSYFSSQNTFVFTHHYVGHFIFIQQVS